MNYKKIIVTSENNYKIVENPLLEHEQKYGRNYRKNMKVKCVADFLDKIINETKKYNH